VSAVLLFDQAVFAGQFLGGSFGALPTHRTNATVAGISVLITAAAGLVMRLRGGPGWPAVACLGLFALIALQILLGFQRMLTVHIPLGVAIIALMGIVTRGAWRRPGTTRSESTQPRQARWRLAGAGAAPTDERPGAAPTDEGPGAEPTNEQPRAEEPVAKEPATQTRRARWRLAGAETAPTDDRAGTEPTTERPAAANPDDTWPGAKRSARQRTGATDPAATVPASTHAKTSEAVAAPPAGNGTSGSVPAAAPAAGTGTSGSEAVAAPAAGNGTSGSEAVAVPAAGNGTRGSEPAAAPAAGDEAGGAR
jgi:hypothetical protein